MPEMIFRVRWPDDSLTDCYSPSLVIKDHLREGETYPLDAFTRISREALTIASNRVAERYGFPCSRAARQIGEIEAKAARFAALPAPTVTVVAFS